jgi:RNA polymerase sigma-70 factor (ECF subfamily)
MERELVERARTGDLEAFGELARAWIDRLYVLARLILRDGDRARDATQEALIVAWRDLSGLRDPDKFGPWIRRLLVTACYREARRTRRRVHVEGQVRPISADLADHEAAAADREELSHGFAGLSPEQRTLIVLHYYVGLPVHETALVMGLPVGTVKSRLSRTTQQMRATLDARARLSPRQTSAT